MYNYNPYYGQQTYTPPRYQPMEPQYMTQQPKGLLGKSVDSVDVVKAIDIPLDGSVSYFPLTDGSAIVTKQLQMDGTSKIMVYKPIIEQKETDAAVNLYKTMTLELAKRYHINTDIILPVAEEEKEPTVNVRKRVLSVQTA